MSTLNCTFLSLLNVVITSVSGFVSITVEYRYICNFWLISCEKAYSPYLFYWNFNIFKMYEQRTKQSLHSSGFAITKSGSHWVTKAFSKKQLCMKNASLDWLYKCSGIKIGSLIGILIMKLMKWFWSDLLFYIFVFRAPFCIIFRQILFHNSPGSQ